MKRNNKVLTMVTAGLLCAIGIVIPMLSPIKLVIPPASYTLASHVPIFIAMFLSPPVAIFVSLGTTLGFLLGGFPLVIVMRALTHAIFATIGSFYLRSHSGILESAAKSLPFNLLIGLIHAACEVVVVLPFYFGGGLSEVNYQKGFFLSIFILVGVGSVIHSMIDFLISLFLWKPLKRVINMPTYPTKNQLVE